MKRVLLILFSAAVLLLVSQLALSLAFPEVPSLQLSEISDEEILRRFNVCLKSFDVKDEWLKRSNKNTSAPTFAVKLPSDLRIAQIIFELTRQYEGYNIQLKPVEKEINGRTSLQVLSDGVVKLIANFDYDKDIQRTTSKTVLFIYERENKEAEFDSLIRNSPRDYSVLLAPSKSSAAYAKWLRENGFEYAVRIKGDSPDLEFKLENDFPEKRVKLIVQNMVVSFPNALFFIIEQNSPIYYSHVNEIIKKELEKRKIKTLTEDSLKFIEMNQSNISGTFADFVKNSDVSKINRVAVSYDAFLYLSEDLKKLVRVGYKFVSTSSFQRELTKTSK